jgi:hypothetical protein
MGNIRAREPMGIAGAMLPLRTIASLPDNTVGKKRANKAKPMTNPRRM